MKRTFLTLFAALLWVGAAFAQTPEEILTRVEENMEAQKQNGVAMSIDIKIPIVGTITSKTYMLGEKSRMDASMMGRSIITWMEGETSWSFDSEDNTITIGEAKRSDDPNDDLSMFSGITDDYDVSIKQETDKQWQLLCRKARRCTDKDAPKTMTVVIEKGSYHPVSLNTKLSGVSMTLYNISFGVKESVVTFRKEDYPDATIIDKR